MGLDGDETEATRRPQRSLTDTKGHRKIEIMKLPVTLERDETGMLVAECPAIPGCVSQGKTEKEALSNILEAILACLEVRAKQGIPLTVRTVEVEVPVG